MIRRTTQRGRRVVESGIRSGAWMRNTMWLHGTSMADIAHLLDGKRAAKPATLVGHYSQPLKGLYLYPPQEDDGHNAWMSANTRAEATGTRRAVLAFQSIPWPELRVALDEDVVDWWRDTLETDGAHARRERKWLEMRLAPEIQAEVRRLGNCDRSKANCARDMEALTTKLWALLADKPTHYPPALVRDYFRCRILSPVKLQVLSAEDADPNHEDVITVLYCRMIPQ